MANDEVSSEDKITVSNEMAWQDSKHSDISDWVDIEDATGEFPFEQRPGIIADVPNNATSLDLFSSLFSDKILDHVVDKTNRYAERLLEAPNILRALFTKSNQIDSSIKIKVQSTDFTLIETWVSYSPTCYRTNTHVFNSPIIELQP